MPIDPVVGAGLVTASAGIVNSILQNKANKRENELAYQRRQEEVNKMNAYNSPAAQVMRLRAAGLSPNLAYGGAGEVTGQQSEIADPIPTHYEQANFSGASSLIDAAVNAREQLNKNDLTKSQIALNSAEGWNAVTRAGLNQAEQKNILDQLGLKLDLMIQQINETKSSADLNKANERLSRAHIQDIYKQWHLTDAQIANVRSQTGLSEATQLRILSLLPHEVQNMDADTALKWIQTQVGSATIQKISNEIMMNNEYLALAEYKYDLDVSKFSWSQHIDQQNLDNARQKLKNDKDFQQGFISVQKGSLDLRERQFSWQKGMDIANFVEGTAVDVVDCVVKLKNPIAGTVVSSPKVDASGKYLDHVEEPYYWN